MRLLKWGFNVPKWVSWIGLGEHLVVGFAMTLITIVLPTTLIGKALLLCISAAGLGYAHELADGDFKPENNGPRNGIIDVLAFIVIPVIFLIYAIIVTIVTTHRS